MSETSCAEDRETSLAPIYRSKSRKLYFVAKLQILKQIKIRFPSLCDLYVTF